MQAGHTELRSYGGSTHLYGSFLYYIFTFFVGIYTFINHTGQVRETGYEWEEREPWKDRETTH